MKSWSVSYSSVFLCCFADGDRGFLTAGVLVPVELADDERGVGVVGVPVLGGLL